jgi:pyridoxamine 5'-phosphate oxidase
MNQDPIDRFKELLIQAAQLGIEPHNAFALASTGNDMKPTVRMVLLKQVDERGFVFYTNVNSHKGHQFSENPRASACFCWPQLKRQVRVEGSVELVSDWEADEYFATRARASQIAAWASPQSSHLSSRDELLVAVKIYAEKYKDGPVPRPPHWSGYRLVPERIEFWREQPNRLHEREVYTLQPDGWKVTLLAP